MKNSSDAPVNKAKQKNHSGKYVDFQLEEKCSLKFSSSKTGLININSAQN